MNKIKNIAPAFLRIGLGLVIMWFGFQQLLHPDVWTGFLPDFVKSFPISQTTFVYLNGWFEIFASSLLIMGVFIRILSALMALHLLGIVISIGYDPIAMRDLGLTIALFAIAMNGTDNFSLEKDSQNYSNEVISRG